jgi:LPXTG-site transpeptidase (sortase) family protein
LVPEYEIMALTKTKKIFVVVGVLLLVFLFLDFFYFWANLQFFLRGNTVSYQTSQSLSASQKTQPNTLNITSLGIKAPVVYPTEKTESAYQAALINGVAHFPGTALPGALGNCYIFGHSSDFIWSKGHYKSVFAVLPKIQMGAEINISDQQGNEFTYTVVDSRKVAADDLSVLDQQGYKKKLLTLQTSYPIGTALARWVVIAEIKNP